MNWIFWAPLIAASLHIFEEFVFPGHFSEWYKKYKPAIKKSITTRFLIFINVGLLIICYDISAFGPSELGVATWLGVMAMLAANEVWHLRGVLKTRSYSPGIITGILLYIPLAVYGYVLFLSTNQIAISLALLAFLIGASFQLWPNIFHRFRSKKIRT